MIADNWITQKLIEPLEELQEFYGMEPKVYVSAGPSALLDGGNESLVATCIAERGRPTAEVFWETELYGRSERQSRDEPNSTTTVHVHYLWKPQSYAQGKTLTCVVRHPALQTEFRIPYPLNVQFAPVVSIKGIEKNWYVGQTNVKFTCGAKANPPARYITWIRLDALMPEGVVISNNSLAFTRPLERNDSAIYRCEVINDIGINSQDVNLWVQDPPPTTAAPSTTTSIHDPSRTGTAADQRRALFTSPTLASLSDSTLGTIVGGAVGGVLFLVLLLILGGVCFMRQRRTFRGDYYTKQYLGPSDMQKESQLDVLQPHELQEVYGDKTSKGSQDLKPKLGGDIIYPDYTPERKDRDDWADRGDAHRGLKEGNYYPDHYNMQNMHPCGPPVHSPIVNNGSPYLPEDCYDNGTDSDYVSHMDGSVISRRECTTYHLWAIREPFKLGQSPLGCQKHVRISTVLTRDGSFMVCTLEPATIPFVKTAFIFLVSCRHVRTIILYPSHPISPGEDSTGGPGPHLAEPPLPDLLFHSPAQ
ncbi:nectin-3-like protein [Pholidichthys leucotaenia]